MDAATEASLEESNSQQPEIVETENVYFSVSTKKLIVMTLCTLGLYNRYWFYKNFVRMQQIDQPNISPVLRTVFAPLWSYSIFKHIQETADYKELGLEVHAVWCAAIYFLIQLSSRLPDPYFILGLLVFAPLIAPNIAATEINQSLNPNFEQNEKFSRWNWAAIAIGSMLLIAIAIGLFLPEQN